MNIILVVCDSFRADHVGAYGGPAGQTPNLDRLASESVVFERAFAGSFPTLPCRAELFTGKFVAPYLGWGPLPKGETVLADVLAQQGYHSCMILDNLPLSKRNYGYDRGFQSRMRIRGQWYDNLRPISEATPFPAPKEKIGFHHRVEQYLANTSIRKGEEDFFAPQVFKSAINWLEQVGQKEKFFLHIDCFDPHEPWDPPEEYIDHKIVNGERIIYPQFGRASRYDEGELRQIRELYAGEVRMADRWTGKLLEAVDGLGLRENTAVIFISDHGIFLGEHDLLGKAGKQRLDVNGWPPYHEVGHVPFMLRVPGVAPRRVGAQVQPGDLMPTILDLAGVKTPGTVHLSSLLPILRGEKEKVRNIGVTAWSYRGWRDHHPSCIRNEDWSMIWWRTGIRPELYDLRKDPEETQDVYEAHPDVARQLHGEYVDYLKNAQAPPVNYYSRRFFMVWTRKPPIAANAGVGE